MLENENHSADLFDEPSKDLGDLDAAFTDPFVERVLEMGRTYNIIFKETAPSLEEITSIIEELDSEWGNIKGTLIHYTGKVNVRSLEDENETNEVFLDGAQVVSNGFYIDYKDSPSGDIYKVQHHLFVNFNDAYGIDSEEHETKVAGATGDIDSSLIELDSASPERAKAWLSVSCPQLIEEIDYRALNGSGGEGDALLSLRGLDFNEYVDLNDLFTRNCINIYIQSILEVDTSAPYSAKLNGYARKPEDLSHLYNLKADASLIYISGIAMQPSYNLNDTDTGWSLSAFVSVLEENRTDESQHYILPVETIQELQSIRSAFYAANA